MCVFVLLVQQKSVEDDLSTYSLPLGHRCLMQQKQSHSIIPRENQTLQWSGVNKRAALKDSKSAFLKSKHFKRALSLMFTLISKSNKTGW